MFPKQYKKTKYKNTICKYQDKTFHSKKELYDFIKLDDLQRSGKIKSVKRQRKIEIVVNGVHVCNHYVDFEIEMNDGRVKWVETKGLPTETWRIKEKLVKALFQTEYLVNPTEKEVLK